MPTAPQLVQAYDLHLASRWLNPGESAGAFETWLEHYWCADGGPEPARAPDDASTLGGTDYGLRAYTEGELILGFVSARRMGCYRIPVNTSVPPVIWPPNAHAEQIIRGD
ncbi:MAG TPA: hypothetical protein VFL82_00985 [Thermomicrobiales bacterium]|nr:hypothetical protein [Thermomicrobiales bacterium]